MVVSLVGPILEDAHRIRAVENIAAELCFRAGERSYYDPRTWLSIARDLGIRCVPYDGMENGSRGNLVFSVRRDQWLIELNVAYSTREICETLVHELAHWFERAAESEWLCGERIIYYYEGPLNDERHRIACMVEDLIFKETR